MAYEYRIEINPSTYYSDLRERGWAEVWKIFVYYHAEGDTWGKDIAHAPKDYPAPRGHFYLAPSKAEAKAKAEKIARDHAAELKAEALVPLKYTLTVE